MNIFEAFSGATVAAIENPHSSTVYLKLLLKDGQPGLVILEYCTWWLFKNRELTFDSNGEDIPRHLAGLLGETLDKISWDLFLTSDVSQDAICAILRFSGGFRVAVRTNPLIEADQSSPVNLINMVVKGSFAVRFRDDFSVEVERY